MEALNMVPLGGEGNDLLGSSLIPYIIESSAGLVLVPPEPQFSW